MKTTVSIAMLIFLIVLFPLLNSGAFADFVGGGTLGMDLVLEPVTLVLFGIGLILVGSRV